MMSISSPIKRFGFGVLDFGVLSFGFGVQSFSFGTVVLNRKS